MILWVATTNDEIEQIVYMANTYKELANLCGVTADAIMKYMRRRKNGINVTNGSKYKYFKVEVEDDD